MSHIAELALAFPDASLLEAVLAKFPVDIRRDSKMNITRGGQRFATQQDVLPLVAKCRDSGEELGFRRRPLTAEEHAALVDKSESRRGVRPPSDCLVPVGDMFYGGLADTFGKGLGRLRAEYYAEGLRRTLGRRSAVTVTETADEILVEASL